MTLTTIIVIYVCGVFASLWFLKHHAEIFQLGDYDEPKTYVNQDDYDSNAEAYVSFSLAWPMFYLVGLLVLIGRWSVKTYKLYLNNEDETLK